MNSLIKNLELKLDDLRNNVMEIESYISQLKKYGSNDDNGKNTKTNSKKVDDESDSDSSDSDENVKKKNEEKYPENNKSYDNIGVKNVSSIHIFDKTTIAIIETDSCKSAPIIKLSEEKMVKLMKQIAGDEKNIKLTEYEMHEKVAKKCQGKWIIAK